MGEPSLKLEPIFTRFLFNSAQQVQEEEVPQDQEPVDGRNRSWSRNDQGKLLKKKIEICLIEIS